MSINTHIYLKNVILSIPEARLQFQNSTFQAVILEQWQRILKHRLQEYDYIKEFTHWLTHLLYPILTRSPNNKTKLHSGSQEVTNLFLQHYQHEWVGFPLCTQELKATESGSSGIQQLTSSKACCQQSIHTRLCEAEYKPLLKEV